MWRVLAPIAPSETSMPCHTTSNRVRIRPGLSKRFSRDQASRTYRTNAVPVCLDRVPRMASSESWLSPCHRLSPWIAQCRPGSASFSPSRQASDFARRTVWPGLRALHRIATKLHNGALQQTAANCSKLQLAHSTGCRPQTATCDGTCNQMSGGNTGNTSWKAWQGGSVFAAEQQYPWIPEALSWPLPWHSKDPGPKHFWAATSPSPRNFASLAVAGSEEPLHRNLEPPWVKNQAQDSPLMPAL